MKGASELELIKHLRELTRAGIMDCKLALKQAKGNLDEAIKILRKKGASIAAKKAERTAQQGIIESYIHTGGGIGVLVEVNCETDFVARNEMFKKFVKDIAMQIAATNPLYIKKEDVPKKVLDEQLAINADLDKFYKETCLLQQAFIKDETQTINDYLVSTIAKTGENIVINRFTRYQLGTR